MKYEMIMKGKLLDAVFGLHILIEMCMIVQSSLDDLKVVITDQVCHLFESIDKINNKLVILLKNIFISPQKKN